MSRGSFPYNVGTAGWSIPKAVADEFPKEGTHLERYAQCLTAVEINSSFYRSHKPSTYARWAAAVPDEFRFSVKMPREITHVRKLALILEPLERFLMEIGELGKKLGPILVQFPPSLRYDATLAGRFFGDLRERFSGNIVCEPRHRTWFTEDVNDLLEQNYIARVAADPAVVPQANMPGGYLGILYCRLHGAPKIYYSQYSARQIRDVAELLFHAPAQSREHWCIFDNTALGHATEDARRVLKELSKLR